MKPKRFLPFAHFTWLAAAPTGEARYVYTSIYSFTNFARVKPSLI